MNMENKIAVYAVVALLVGAVIGVGAGYALFHSSGDDSSAMESYSFYLYFGDDDQRTKWYTADGTDAADGFDKAMKAADMTYEVSSYGYIGAIDGEGSWYIAQYLYAETTKAAADASILYPTESFGTLKVSNGWASVSGYDGVEGLKLCEFNSNVYFMSIYQADYSAASPASTTGWMTTGPFAA